MDDAIANLAAEVCYEALMEAVHVVRRCTRKPVRHEVLVTICCFNRLALRVREAVGVPEEWEHAWDKPAVPRRVHERHRSR